MADDDDLPIEAVAADADAGETAVAPADAAAAPADAAPAPVEPAPAAKKKPRRAPSKAKATPSPAPAEPAPAEAAPAEPAPVASLKPARKPRTGKPFAIKPRKAARKPKIPSKTTAVTLAPPAAAKPAASRRAPARGRPSRRIAPVTTPVTPKKTPPQKATVGKGKPKFEQLKETLMATPFDLTIFKTAFADLQGKAKAALEKGTAALGEANEFAKGNVEAFVQSGKILSSGLQDLGTTMVAETRGAFETLATDAKELAAAKSPTEFLQLQSTIARKQFDGAVAQTSKTTEAFLKLANDTFAPLSGRVTLAVEKVSKAA